MYYQSSAVCVWVCEYVGGHVFSCVVQTAQTAQMMKSYHCAEFDPFKAFYNSLLTVAQFMNSEQFSSKCRHSAG